MDTETDNGLPLANLAGHPSRHCSNRSLALSSLLPPCKMSSQSYSDPLVQSQPWHCWVPHSPVTAVALLGVTQSSHSGGIAGCHTVQSQQWHCWVPHSPVTAVALLGAAQSSHSSCAAGCHTVQSQQWHCWVSQSSHKLIILSSRAYYDHMTCDRKYLVAGHIMRTH